MHSKEGPSDLDILVMHDDLTAERLRKMVEVADRVVRAIYRKHGVVVNRWCRQTSLDIPQVPIHELKGMTLIDLYDASATGDKTDPGIEGSPRSREESKLMAASEARVKAAMAAARDKEAELAQSPEAEELAARELTTSEVTAERDLQEAVAAQETRDEPSSDVKYLPKSKELTRRAKRLVDREVLDEPVDVFFDRINAHPAVSRSQFKQVIYRIVNRLIALGLDPTQFLHQLTQDFDRFQDPMQAVRYAQGITDVLQAEKRPKGKQNRLVYKAVTEQLLTHIQEDLAGKEDTPGLVTATTFTEHDAFSRDILYARNYEKTEQLKVQLGKLPYAGKLNIRARRAISNQYQEFEETLLTIKNGGSRELIRGAVYWIANRTARLGADPSEFFVDSALNILISDIEKTASDLYNCYISIKRINRKTIIYQYTKRIYNYIAEIYAYITKTHKYVKYLATLVGRYVGYYAFLTFSCAMSIMAGLILAGFGTLLPGFLLLCLTPRTPGGDSFLRWGIISLYVFLSCLFVPFFLNMIFHEVKKEHGESFQDYPQGYTFRRLSDIGRLRRQIGESKRGIKLAKEHIRSSKASIRSLKTEIRDEAMKALKIMKVLESSNREGPVVIADFLAELQEPKNPHQEDVDSSI